MMDQHVNAQLVYKVKLNDAYLDFQERACDLDLNTIKFTKVLVSAGVPSFLD